MAENTTLARFAPGDNISRAFPNLWQWSRGQVLQIEGLTLPAHYTVHFSNSPFGYDPASEGQIGDAEGVDVPDSMLQSGQPVYAWIWLSETTSAETAAQVIIEVNRRAQPPNYEPTPEEESIIDQAIAALNEGVDQAEAAAAQAEAAVEKYPRVINGNWYVWDEATEEWIDTEVPATGPTGVGIASITQNADYTLTITFTDGNDWTTPTSVRGAQGETGATPNLSIGTVSTLAAGSPASASITGTPENPVLNLGIPKGDEGPQGPIGNPTDAQVQTAVSTWLGENVDPETGYVLDRTLTQANAAAPADLVGSLKSAVDDIATAQSINFYNPNDPDVATSKMIDGYGTLTNSSDFDVSGFIPILPNVEYEVPIYKGKIGESARAIPIYDANKNYIQRLVSVDYSDTTKRLKFVTTNADARFTRVNVSKRGVKTLYVTPWHYYGIFMLTKTPFPTKFYPYGVTELFAGDYRLSVSQEQNYNPLIENSAAFFGDSIGYGDDYDGWAGRIGRANRMTWMNASISGATFSKNGVSACIAEQSVPFENPKYLIFEGGTNDADRIGDATGETKPEEFGTWSENDYGTDDAATNYGFDITTFCGAVEIVCKKFVSNYPSAKIGFIAAQKMGTVDATRANRGYYIHTAMEICKKWGIPCLNLWDESHLNPLIPSHYTSGEDYMYSDGQHLTANGYEYLTPIVNAWMKTL